MALNDDGPIWPVMAGDLTSNTLGRSRWAVQGISHNLTIRSVMARLPAAAAPGPSPDRTGPSCAVTVPASGSESSFQSPPGALLAAPADSWHRDRRKCY